jgi:hypothetical protein
MINEETKKQFLEELEKSGNVYLSCRKIGIARMTFFRWRKGSPEFKKLADLAIKLGRADLVDAALHGLKKKVLEGDMNGVKYVLSHNDPRYKPKKPESQVVIIHRSPDKVKIAGEKTLEDLIDRLDNDDKQAES